MTVSARLDRFQQRHSWLGLPIAVIYKFVDDQGNYLAGLMTYYAFLSFFPLLLVASTILGFVLQGNLHLQQELIGSALSQFPIIGTQIQSNVHGYRGSGAALIIGVIGSLYGSIGVVQASQNALNQAWAVPRNARPNAFKSRLRSLLALLPMGVGVLATTGLSALATGAKAFNSDVSLGIAPRLGASGVAIVINLVLFVVAFRMLTARAVSTRDVLIGAIVAAVAWQALQSLGTYYIAHKLKGVQEIYGVFGIVLGLVAWLHVESLVVVLSAELNVVLHRRLWPRALLTPFSEKVTLTGADERAYNSYARVPRFKHRQRIESRFDDPAPPPASSSPPDGP